MEAPQQPVLLISCYELGQQPLGITVPGGVLARAGIPVVYNDIAVEQLDEKTAATASLIGISTPMHTALRLGVRLARRLREVAPSAHICFFGLYAELNADYLRRAGLADTCLGPECEGPLLALALGERDAAAAEGVLPGPRGSRDLDLTPWRGRLLGNPHYVKVEHDGAQRTVGYVASTRGCRHTCRHCPVTPVYRGRFYAVDVASILSDVSTLVDSGVSHVTFADPDFLNGPGQARRVARAIHARFPDLTFDYTAKIEHLDRHRDLVAELLDCGNLFVVSAVESLNDTVLEYLDKGHTRRAAIDVIRYFRRIGLALRPTLVPFTPWESPSSLLDLMDVIESEGVVEHIDTVQYAIRLLVPPGSALLDLPAMKPHLGALDRANFSYAWTHPDPRMDALQRRIAAIAEAAAAAHQRPGEAFADVQDAVADAAGARPARPHRAPNPVAAAPPPRLTEAWFC